MLDGSLPDSSRNGGIDRFSLFANLGPTRCWLFIALRVSVPVGIPSSFVEPRPPALQVSQSQHYQGDARFSSTPR